MKECKEVEDQFEKVQKQWVKHSERINRTKAEYHGACRTKKMSSLEEQCACVDSSISQEQVIILESQTF